MIEVKNGMVYIVLVYSSLHSGPWTMAVLSLFYPITCNLLITFLQLSVGCVVSLLVSPITNLGERASDIVVFLPAFEMTCVFFFWHTFFFKKKKTEVDLELLTCSRRVYVCIENAGVDLSDEAEPLTFRLILTGSSRITRHSTRANSGQG
jgi:hypothetical protein